MSELEKIVNREHLVRKINEEIIQPYLRTFSGSYTLFSFGSCNTEDKTEVSDVDMTLILDKGYLKLGNNFKQIRDKLAEIESDCNFELHLHIGNYDFMDADNPLSATPSSRFDETEGWGQLANHYRLFYIAMTGKTELGDQFVERLKNNRYLSDIPNHEGEELYACCKRDAINAFLDGLIAKKEGNYLELKKASNKLSKSILRTIEAFRIRTGLPPSWDESSKRVYPAITHNYEFISKLDLQEDYSNLVKTSLGIKCNNDLVFEFDVADQNEFKKFFSYFKNKFMHEVLQSTEHMPLEKYPCLKNYNLATAELICKRITDKNLFGYHGIESIIYILSDNIIDFVEEEYAKVKESKILSNEKLTKTEKEIIGNFETAKTILVRLSNFGNLKNKAMARLNGPKIDKDYLAFVGRAALICENYVLAEQKLEEFLKEEKTSYNSNALIPEVFDSLIYLRLAESKLKLNKFQEAKNMVANALNLYPLHGESWAILDKVMNNPEFGEISKILKSEDRNFVEKIAKNEKISIDGVSLFLGFFRDYFKNKLDEDISSFEKYSENNVENLEKKINELLDSSDSGQISKFDISQYLFFKRQKEILSSFISELKLHKSRVEGGIVYTDEDYYNLLKSKKEAIKCISDLELANDTLRIQRDLSDSKKELISFPENILAELKVKS